jgi:hypothetical protein
LDIGASLGGGAAVPLDLREPCRSTCARQLRMPVPGSVAAAKPLRPLSRIVLLGPLAVKMASTGYRFARYYTGSPAYRSKGPPEPIMRLTATIVVASTIVVFASGILLLLQGPQSRDPYLPLHKASFVVWLGVTGLHVLWHLPGLLRSLRAASSDGEFSATAPGADGRLIMLLGSLVSGVVLAVVLIPQFASWTSHLAALRGH